MVSAPLTPAQETGKKVKSLTPELDASMVKVYKKSGDTALVNSQVMLALAAVPMKLKQELNQSGVHIVIVPSIPEYHPELAGKTANASAEKDYSHEDAQFREKQKEIVVAERVAHRSDEPDTDNQVARATLRELGHAIDSYNGWTSSTPEFIDDYIKDRARMAPAMIAKAHNYLQPGGKAGRKALFAELFQINRHGRARIKPRNEYLTKAFPMCSADVDRTIMQLGE